MSSPTLALSGRASFETSHSLKRRISSGIGLRTMVDGPFVAPILAAAMRSAAQKGDSRGRTISRGISRLDIDISQAGNGMQNHKFGKKKKDLVSKETILTRWSSSCIALRTGCSIYFETQYVNRTSRRHVKSCVRNLGSTPSHFSCLAICERTSLKDLDFDFNTRFPTINLWTSLRELSGLFVLALLLWVSGVARAR